MAYEMLMGLLVKDERNYQQYREAMLPILKEYGGGFRYDFRISDVLRTQAEHEINRVFTIHFRDQSACDGFFADNRYKEVRTRFFDTSVRGTTVIAKYEIEDGT